MQYRAILFRHSPPTPDFSRSSQIELPGDHPTHEAAWRAMLLALADGGPEMLGGEVVFAETVAEAVAETLPNP